MAGLLPAVGVTVFQRSARAPFVVALLSCLLLVIGFNVAPASSNSAFSFVNRTIGGCAFLMIALIVSRAIRPGAGNARALAAGSRERGGDEPSR